MKLTTFLILVTALQVSAKTFSQERVSVDLKEVKLTDALKIVEQKSSYRFVFSHLVLTDKIKVSVRAKEMPVEDLLKLLLQHTRLTYQVAGLHLITIKYGKGYDVLVLIRGKVTDANGQPLANINVSGGTGSGTVTNELGEFSIDAQETDSLTFSSVGYETKTVYVGKNTILNITLTQNTTELSDVVVVGFGKQRKTSMVSSVSTISGNELSFPTRNLTNNLAGQVAGLIAIQRSGEPGYDNSEFWIRGVSSFSGGTNPLILVDGVPRSMNDIEPDEIETFTLLKDAAATAVYGAEGANGVILITSKRGTVQKTKISYRGEYSNLQPTRMPQLVGSVDYMTLYNESLTNEDKAPVFSQELIAKYASGEDLDLYPNSLWLDMLRKTTYNTRHTLNFRGGGEKARFFVSGAYFKESGIFKDNPLAQYQNNIGLQRYNLRSNVDLNVTPTTLLRVDLSGQYLQTNYPGVGTATIFQRMTTIPPYLFPAIYSDGTNAGHPRPSNNRINPYNLLMESGYAKEWRSNIQSRVDLEQKLDVVTPGLMVKASASYDASMFFQMTRLRTPRQSMATSRDAQGKLIFSQISTGSPDFGEPVETNSGDKRIYLEASANYNRSFAKDHVVGAMILGYQKEIQYHNQALAFRKQGYVGRLTYSYANRYSIEGNFGFTGSEAFAEEYRFGFFPAVGVSWFASNEPFFPDALRGVVSKLKVRASIGRTGNDDTGGERFLYRGTYNNAAGGFPFGIGGSGSLNSLAGLIEGRFEAPMLGWEIEDKKNFGVDLGFFNGRVDLQVDYFDNYRYNILLQRRTVAGAAGFRQAPWQNFGKVTNKGIDGSINVNHKIGGARLSYRGNITYARNKIIEYDEVPQLYPWMNITGTRLRSWHLYVAEGLYTAEDFVITQNANGTKNYKLNDKLPISALSAGVRPGDIKYKDLNGDGTINQFDQTREYGDPSVPELIYGFGVNFDYEGFYASIFFQGAGNTSTVYGANLPQSFFPFAWGIDESSARVEALNRWTEANPRQDVLYPRMHSTAFAHNQVPSTWWLRDASFIRLKNVEIGYRLPKQLLQRLHMDAARIYLMGYNVAVWDKIKMWDPEMGNANEGMNYPLPRTFTLGLELNF